MSVYIPNMEMPTSPVLFCIHPDGKVFADLEGGWREYKIAPIPPHGRLIDADALIEKVIAKYLEHERKGELVFAAAEIKQDIVDLISDAPTIIPAEEGET